MKGNDESSESTDHFVAPKMSFLDMNMTENKKNEYNTIGY